MEYSKKEQIEALLDQYNLHIYLDPHISNVPEQFKNQDTLILYIGYNLAVPMRDFSLTDDFLKVTLSFNRSPHYCEIPLKAIYMVNIEKSNYGLFFEEDVPAKVASQFEAQEKRKQFKVVSNTDSNTEVQKSDKPKPALRLVK